MAKSYVTLSEQNFMKEVLESPRPVLVDFWADWCAPCRAIAPTIEKLADRFADKATVAKLNVDDEEALARQYGIRSIPTLLFFVDGEIVDQVVGAARPQELTAKLEALV